MVEAQREIHRTKWGRSKEIHFPRPNYLEFADEANQHFGQALADDTLLKDVYNFEGVVGDYIQVLPKSKEGRQRRFALKSFVGVARRIGLETVGQVREIGEEELGNRVLEKLGKESPYKVSPVYLKSLFHIETPET